MKGWHFLPQDRRLRYGTKMKAVAGYVYSVPGPVTMCQWGLHASERAIDALWYAPGAIVCRVRLYGEIEHGEDKSVATHREILWMADATEALRSLARSYALDLIHLWDAPKVVREYLNTGDPSIRRAAWTAVQAAQAQACAQSFYRPWADSHGAVRVARAAASRAARDDAWIAARDAVHNAALDVRLTDILEELCPAAAR